MATAAIFIGDTHAGSMFGLWHPGARSDAEGGKRTLDPYQQYLWECWQHAITVWLPGEIGNAHRVGLLSGDMVDGVNGKLDTFTDDEMLQVDGACAAISILSVESWRAVSGTVFHAGKSAKWDNAVAAKLGAVPDARGRYAQWQLFIDLEGVTIDLAHHIGGSYVQSSQATPLTREYNDAGMSVYEGDWPKAEWIVRGHSHRYRTIPYRAATVISLPGWQAKTPVAHRISRAAPFDIGMFVLVCDDGKGTPLVKLYRWPSPKQEVVRWNTKNPNPSSAMLTGLVSSMQKKLRCVTGH